MKLTKTPAILRSIIGWMAFMAIQPIHSICVTEPDSVSESWRQLDELVIVSQAPRRLTDPSAESGAINIDARYMTDHPSLLGSNDAIALLKTLPAVATPNDLQAALSVHGLPPAYTHYESDGVRLINPLHMLGLYSTFNPEVYTGYRFVTSGAGALTPSTGGPLLSAYTADAPADALHGAVSAGILESHAALAIPVIRDRLSLRVGARQSYLNLLFPDILRFGNSYLRYAFTDINAVADARLSAHDLLKISFFYSRDAMKVLISGNGDKDGDFGWGNIAGGVRWSHDSLSVGLAASRFSNFFTLQEGGATLNLPTLFSHLRADAGWRAGAFSFGADISRLHTSGQRNVAVSSTDRVPDPAMTGWEWNLAAEWQHSFFGRLHLAAGMRLAGYHTPGYHRIVPQPRISADLRLSRAATLFLSYGRYVKFDRLVEESTTGMPVNFFTLADAATPAEDTHSFSFGCRGTIPFGALDYSLEGYWQMLRHAGEYAGSLLNLASAGYSPLSDLLDGRGYACGLSAMLSRSIGAVRGTIGYTLGKSRLKFDRYGNHYFPAAHDRMHDLSATLMWQPLTPLTISGTFTYATGLPYTQAKYGYMIGENLICEYYPHNSSRLPAYRRLDLSASYTLTSRNGFRHTFNISIFNALASRNIIFRYTSYSLSEGIIQNESVMKVVIPSFTYTFRF